MRCLVEKKFCQHVEATLDYGFDVTREFTRRWQADQPYDTGIVVRPETVTTGFQYRSSGGQSGSEEPAWPLENAGTVTDGSITWTAEPYTADALLDQVDTDSWTVDDSALIVNAQSPTILPGLQRTLAILSEGVVGQTYKVENFIHTVNNRDYVARILLTITD